LFGHSHSQENAMNRKHEPKNDFFYSLVMFAMFAVVVFSVAAEFIDRHPEAFFVDTNEALKPRELAANVDVRAIAANAPPMASNTKPIGRS